MNLHWHKYNPLQFVFNSKPLSLLPQVVWEWHKMKTPPSNEQFQETDEILQLIKQAMFSPVSFDINPVIPSTF